MSIFGEDQNNEFTPEVTIPEGETAFDTLVGEGKKFRDPEALAKSKLEADAYIEYLKQKTIELQQDLNTRMSLEQFADKLRAPVTPPVNPDEVRPPAAEDQGKGIDPEKLLEIVEQKLAEREQKKAVETNLEKVHRVLTEKLGGQAKQFLQKQASETGMTVKELENLAARSPQAFFKLVGVSEAPDPQVVPRVPSSSVNPLTNSRPTGVRGHSYYENLKKTDPKTYNSPATMSQQFKDMKELGLEAYYQL